MRLRLPIVVTGPHDAPSGLVLVWCRQAALYIGNGLFAHDNAMRASSTYASGRAKRAGVDVILVIVQGE
jgi:hypothetical protein